MKILDMNKYGSIFTGREFCQDLIKLIQKENSFPVALNFEGVISISASFADEVLVPIAKNQSNTLEIYNASNPVWACILDVALDGEIIVKRK